MKKYDESLLGDDQSQSLDILDVLDLGRLDLQILHGIRRRVGQIKEIHIIYKKNRFFLIVNL